MGIFTRHIFEFRDEVERECVHADVVTLCVCLTPYSSVSLPPYSRPVLTPYLPRGIAILGLAMSPGGLLRETRPNLATLSFFNADFLTVSPRSVTLLLSLALLSA